MAFATSRVELTLNANLLPSKVASPSRGDAADPATNGTVPRFFVSFASMSGTDGPRGGAK
jgi:hypothetical protein